MTDGQATDHEVYLAALSGLLHDLGKFAQRANWQRGTHTEVGGEFVRRYVPKQWQEHLYPVMGHHDRPLQGYVTKVVALANHLSAGERADEGTEQPQQLLSIFCRLEADKARIPPELYRYWPLESLAMSKDVLFPDEPWDKTRIETAYGDLWGDFTEEVEALAQAHAEPDSVESDLPTYLENLLLLMQRYTWCVPSAYYRSLPDVSLYDHSRTTAGLAACLVGRSEEWVDALLDNPRDKEEPAALLVGGDISGVQDFIYTITARGATSALRGRSFYLQLLTEAVARFVLRRLTLPVTNLIYQGGGSFYLLARSSDAESLQGVQLEISRILLAHHRGDLYLALSSVPLAAADFYDGRIADRWDDLARTLRGAKQRRFAELEKAGLEALVTPQGHGGDQDKQCQVCGREHPETGVKKRAGEEEGVRKCPPCVSYEEMGDDLRRGRYLWLEERDPVIPEEPLRINPGGWEDVLAAFGLRGGVTEEPPQDSDAAHRLILALKDKSLDGLYPNAHTAVGRRFLVNVTPVYTLEDDHWLALQPETTQKRIEQDLPPNPVNRIVKPFSVLEAQSKGIKRLGVLRMDVDNLGELFSGGFALRHDDGTEERIATLSRVAALSFAISLYFEGWVGQIATAFNEKTKQQGRGEVLYSIYSGGDDLFFVGSWDAVVELARTARADLACFSANHPGIHASAGVALVGGKYPLYQAARDAGTAESMAKDLKWRDAGGREHAKDAVTFLDQALPWERFGLELCEQEGMDTAHTLAHSLVKMVDPEREDAKAVPQTLLRHLIRVHEMHEAAAEARRKRGEDLSRSGEEQVYWGPWMWRGYYSLKQMARRYEKDERGKVIETLAEKLHGDRFRAIEWIGLAARWADLLTR